MTRLLITHLRPYRAAILVVLALQLVQAIANLYLPDLNADIINNGVVRGNTDYVLRTGGLMLVVTLLLGVARSPPCMPRRASPWASGATSAATIFRAVESFSQTEINVFGTASLITRNTNDVQQVQMVVMLALSMMIAAPMMAIGGVIMALRQDVPLSGPARRDPAGHGRRSSP